MKHWSHYRWEELFELFGSHPDYTDEMFLIVPATSRRMADFLITW